MSKKGCIKSVSRYWTSEDYISPDLTGDKLWHYNEKGIDKLTKALSRHVSTRTPSTRLTRRDFYNIDPIIRGNNGNEKTEPLSKICWSLGTKKPVIYTQNGSNANALRRFEASRKFIISANILRLETNWINYTKFAH